MYRIVRTDITRLYRVEKRRLLGRDFVIDPATRDYLGFGDL